MVIERFEDNDLLPIYKRLRDGGRMCGRPALRRQLVEPNFARCFQLMECDDLRLFQQWTLQWPGRVQRSDRPCGIKQDTR